MYTLLCLPGESQSSSSTSQHVLSHVSWQDSTSHAVNGHPGIRCVPLSAGHLLRLSTLHRYLKNPSTQKNISLKKANLEISPPWCPSAHNSKTIAPIDLICLHTKEYTCGSVSSIMFWAQGDSPPLQDRTNYAIKVRRDVKRAFWWKHV